MKINIYGVGRSGTKAVQLYIAYSLAKNYGKVRINYEPYFWLTRKGPVSFRGLYHHLNAPEFLDHNDSISAKHIKFLRSLHDHSNSIPCVTKFIRGCGRINKINEIMKPDYTIVVIRGLYDVLSSILQLDWDFHRFGYDYFYLSRRRQLTKLIKSAREKDLIPDYLNNQINKISNSDRVLTNALYWYLMNKHLLSTKVNATIYLNYKNVFTLPKLLATINEKVFSKNIDLTQFNYKGNNMHNDILLKDFSKNKMLQKKKLNLLNEYIFYLGTSFRNKYPIFVNRKVGTISQLQENIIKHEEIPPSKHKIHVEKTDILNLMESEIKSLLKNKQSNYPYYG